MKFIEFPKMARFSREIVITEKIDGTNASIFIQDLILEEDPKDPTIIGTKHAIAGEQSLTMRIGSRTRWITPSDDNFGFAKWCSIPENFFELLKLGEGHHFGEWWGSGIQRGYGLLKGEKRFSLFNTSRWQEGSENTPKCCHVVPELYRGVFCTDYIDDTLSTLQTEGSKAAPGFMKPEGIVIYHTAGNVGFKKTIEKDETPKSLQ